MDSVDRTRSIAGAVLIVAGVATASLVFLHPEGLRAPAWVAFAAALACVCAGILAILGQSGSPRLQAWMAVALLVLMFAPAVWIAFGAGARKCSFSLPYLSGLAHGWSCRLAFGLASVMGLAMVAWAIRRAIRAGKLHPPSRLP